MGCVLGQHDESGKKEKAIYYLSKKFTECELRYPPIKKLCCVLIWAAREVEAIHVVPYDLANFKIKPFEVYDEVNSIEWKNG